MWEKEGKGGSLLHQSGHISLLQGLNYSVGGGNKSLRGHRGGGEPCVNCLDLLLATPGLYCLASPLLSPKKGLLLSRENDRQSSSCGSEMAVKGWVVPLTPGNGAGRTRLAACQPNVLLPDWNCPFEQRVLSADSPLSHSGKEDNDYQIDD